MELHLCALRKGVKNRERGQPSIRNPLIVNAPGDFLSSNIASMVEKREETRQIANDFRRIHMGTANFVFIFSECSKKCADF